MKIANKGILALGMGVAFMIAPCFFGAAGFKAEAADGPLGAPPMAAAPVQIPTPTLLPAAAPSSPPSAVVTSGADLSKTTSTDISKDLSGAEDRAMDNAKGVIKKLDTTTDAATLEDLNAARQAIARLQAMTEVEKHLADLERARSERTGGHSSLAAAIPASALTPPPTFTMPSRAVEPARSAEDMPHPFMVSSSPEISRISGVDGQYAAVIKTGGDVRTVRVGDKLSGGGTVTFISPMTVQIQENGLIHTLHVKNADVVYSAMR